MTERKRIYLCLAHMSEAGLEQKYIQEAFDTNWVVPLGPNVNGFEKDLEEFVNERTEFNGSKVQEVQEVQEFKSSTLNPLNPSAKRLEPLEPSNPSTVNGKPSTVNQTSKPSAVSGKLTKRVVALSSGTAAVHLGLLNCGVKAGDEVIVQSFTFCASTHPVTYLGATPVLVDSEPDTWNIDPQLLEKAILDRKEKTGKYPKAIVPVALYGMPYKADRIMEIANKYGIPVVEDAAEGMGSRYKGQVLGTFGKYGVLSFNGN